VGGSRINAKKHHPTGQDHGDGKCCETGEATPDERGTEHGDSATNTGGKRIGVSVGIPSDLLDLDAAADEPSLKRRGQRCGRLTTNRGGDTQHRLKLGGVSRITPQTLVNARARPHIRKGVIEHRCNIGAGHLISCRGFAERRWEINTCRRSRT
jgi:hypothetical protein